MSVQQTANMPADSAALLCRCGAAKSLGSSTECLNIHMGKRVKAFGCAGWGVRSEVSA